jgi:Ca2+-binding RTX toxin-like protein
LTLLGTGNINGTGNTLANNITGNGGNNTLKGDAGNDILISGLGNDILVGGAGNDQLTGNSGADRFTFDSGAAFTPTSLGLDRVTDFQHGFDKIVLDKTTFTALKSITGNGFSVATEFAVVSNNTAAATSAALITYDSSSGALNFNQNGATAGFGTGGEFASLSRHPVLTASDFVIQA